jgi:hypothetical protein
LPICLPVIPSRTTRPHAIFKPGADLSSPQGVRNVGPQLFENFILQVLRVGTDLRKLGSLRKKRLALANLVSAKLLSEPRLKGVVPWIGFVFSNSLNDPAVGARTNERWVSFYKPSASTRIGFIAQNG